MTTEQPKKRKHEESTLHLQFCKWVKKNYPNDQFIRHEREQQRSKFLQGLMKVYNTEMDMPDFECLEPTDRVDYTNCDIEGFFDDSSFRYFGLYIEFKKPGTILTLKDGVTIKPEYSGQYATHLKLWDRGRCVYFCSELDQAIALYNAYRMGRPFPKQIFPIPVSKQDLAADNFFNQ